MKKGTLLATATLLVSCAKTAPPPPPSAKIARHATLVEEAEAALHDDMPVDYALPFVERPDRREHRVTAWLRACDAGDKPSCWKAMQMADPSRRAPLAAPVEVNCRAGDVLSCRALSVSSDRRYEGLPGSAGRSEACENKERSCDIDGLRAECADGFPQSCRRLLGVAPRDANELRERIEHLETAGCEAWILDDCDSIAYLPGQELLSEQRLCDLIGRCGGVAIRARSAGKMIEAREASERTCQYEDDSHRCLFLAKAYLDHLYPEPVPGRGQALLDWVCFKFEALLDSSTSILDTLPECARMTPHVRR